MIKFDVKSIIVGLLIGIIGVSIVFLALGKKTMAINEKDVVAVTAAKEIKSAAINNDKVYFNGNDIKLKKPLITIVKDGSSEPQLYMPMDELLEYMHFKVEWNSKNNAVYLTMNGQNNQENTGVIPNISENKTNTESIETIERIQKGMEITADASNNEIDAEAIEIMKKTGNWSYIEKSLPHMTANGIEKVVEIYNSKRANSSEHKKAADYIKN